MDTYVTYIHEVKNALNSIYGLAQIIEDESDLSEQHKYIKMIISAVNSIKEIDKDFDEYKKTGRTSINRSVLYVNTVVNQIINEYKSLAKEYNVEIKTNIKPARAYTDPNKLKQSLRNLISNAIKYSDNKKDNKFISIECQNLGNIVKIIISDNGIGMDEKELKLLGTPFYRSKKIESIGSGLGISLVKKLSSLLNWDLIITSKPAIGTTVVLTLYHIIG